MRKTIAIFLLKRVFRQGQKNGKKITEKFKKADLNAKS